MDKVSWSWHTHTQNRCLSWLFFFSAVVESWTWRKSSPGRKLTGRKSDTHTDAHAHACLRARSVETPAVLPVYTVWIAIFILSTHAKPYTIEQRCEAGDYLVTTRQESGSRHISHLFPVLKQWIVLSNPRHPHPSWFQPLRSKHGATAKERLSDTQFQIVLLLVTQFVSTQSKDCFAGPPQYSYQITTKWEKKLTRTVWNYTTSKFNLIVFFRDPSLCSSMYLCIFLGWVIWMCLPWMNHFFHQS